MAVCKRQTALEKHLPNLPWSTQGRRTATRAIGSMLALIVFFIFTPLCTSAFAQNANAGYAPVANSDIYVILALPDGKALVGGTFTTIDGAACHYPCRLNADGSRDTSFVDPDLDGAVYALALQPDGKLWVGGFFSIAGGQSRRTWTGSRAKSLGDASRPAQRTAPICAMPPAPEFSQPPPSARINCTLARNWRVSRSSASRCVCSAAVCEVTTSR